MRTTHKTWSNSSTSKRSDVIKSMFFKGLHIFDDIHKKLTQTTSTIEMHLIQHDKNPRDTSQISFRDTMKSILNDAIWSTFVSMTHKSYINTWYFSPMSTFLACGFFCFVFFSPNDNQHSALCCKTILFVQFLVFPFILPNFWKETMVSNKRIQL